MNGDFIRAHGHGIQELDARELCDVAYATIIGDIEQHYYALVASGATWKDTQDPLGDDITRFEERIGLRDNPEDIALEKATHRLIDRVSRDFERWSYNTAVAGAMAFVNTVFRHIQAKEGARRATVDFAVDSLLLPEVLTS